MIVFFHAFSNSCASQNLSFNWRARVNGAFLSSKAATGVLSLDRIVSAMSATENFEENTKSDSLLGNVSTSFVLILITSSFIVCLISEMQHVKPHGDWELFPFQAGIYLVKVSNRNTRTKYEICSKKQNDAILSRIRTEYGEILYLSVFSPNVG